MSHLQDLTGLGEHAESTPKPSLLSVQHLPDEAADPAERNLLSAQDLSSTGDLGSTRDLPG